MRSASILVVLCALATSARAQTTSALRIGSLRSEARTPLALEREVVEVECEAPRPSEGEDEDAAPMPCTVRARDLALRARAAIARRAARDCPFPTFLRAPRSFVSRARAREHAM